MSDFNSLALGTRLASGLGRARQKYVFVPYRELAYVSSGDGVSASAVAVAAARRRWQQGGGGVRTATVAAARQRR